jgi:hypothetical protein
MQSRFIRPLLAGAALALCTISALASAQTAYFGPLNVAPHADALYPLRISASLQDKMLTADLVPRHAMQFRMGYQVNRWLGVEAVMGKNDASFLPLRLQSGSRQSGLDAVSSLQVSSAFSVMARAGLRRLSLESDPAQLLPNGHISQARLGLGLQYQMSRSLGFRAEVERSRNLGADRALADTDGDAVRFDLMWRF